MGFFARIKKNHPGFSLIETMVALMILAAIATIVSQVQFTSVFRLSRYHERLRALLRMKKELMTCMLTHKPRDKFEHIDDEKAGIKIVLSVQDIDEKSSFATASSSLQLLKADASWFVWGEKEEMPCSVAWYVPGCNDDQEKK